MQYREGPDVADDNQIVTGIEGTEGALGYVGFSFADENKDKLKILSVDGGKGCVQPTVQTIASGEYAPLSRPLFMYPSVETAPSPRSEDSSASSSTTTTEGLHGVVTKRR